MLLFSSRVGDITRLLEVSQEIVLWKYSFMFLGNMSKTMERKDFFGNTQFLFTTKIHPKPAKTIWVPNSTEKHLKRLTEGRLISKN